MSVVSHQMFYFKKHGLQLEKAFQNQVIFNLKKIKILIKSLIKNIISSIKFNLNSQESDKNGYQSKIAIKYTEGFELDKKK